MLWIIIVLILLFGLPSFGYYRGGPGWGGGGLGLAIVVILILYFSGYLRR